MYRGENMPREKDEQLRVLVEKYAKICMKIAYDNGVPYDDVEDVVMEVFWVYYRSKYFGELDELGAKRMLACMVKRRSVDFFRRNSHYSKVSLEEGILEAGTGTEGESGDPVEKVLQDETFRMIRECIEGMRAIWREPALMYFVEGYEEPEIADALGISGAACRSRISRARKHLKERLGHLWNQD